jgi:DUF1009 family protein
LERWGLIAGRGLLPLEAAKGMRMMGISPVILGLKEEADPALTEALAQAGFPVAWESLGQLGAIRRFFQEQEVRKVVMAGSVGKKVVLTGLEMDEDLVALLAGLPVKHNDAMLVAFAEYFEKHGIEVEKQTTVLSHLLPGKGCLTKRVPTAREEADIRLGYRTAKEVAGLNIGQSVVVKNGMILAVEAIDGTDATILRGGQLVGGGAVVVKVANPRQDLRFDLPVIGPSTLAAVIQSRTAVLAFEAASTFLLEKETTIARADAEGISLVALDEDFSRAR